MIDPAPMPRASGWETFKQTLQYRNRTLDLITGIRRSSTT
jgi:hypothetical protein